ncbi:antitoxin VbhA family protein [Phytoactinopolyspora limicola]|uniref:antitoxin VbhA family protein n=1 Tax=Phytoactinopolyspora limicola TaxID=2715536 RepID=UPI00140C6FDD|nr:antitoxin VbhA family protein [Phytoactinopolyspora limicola]
MREAREQLPGLLARFRKGDHSPIGVDSHRKTEAVVMPIDVYNERTAERDRAAAEATASLRAAGLTPSSEADAITQLWIRGESPPSTCEP